MVVDCHAVSSWIAFIGWQVGSQDGIVECVEVDTHGVQSLVVEPSLVGEEQTQDLNTLLGLGISPSFWFVAETTLYDTWKSFSVAFTKPR